MTNKTLTRADKLSQMKAILNKLDALRRGDGTSVATTGGRVVEAEEWLLREFLSLVSAKAGRAARRARDRV